MTAAWAWAEDSTTIGTISAAAIRSFEKNLLEFMRSPWRGFIKPIARTLFLYTQSSRTCCSQRTRSVYLFWGIGDAEPGTLGLRPSLSDKPASAPMPLT
jgi:hypothetical protein